MASNLEKLAAALDATPVVTVEGERVTVTVHAAAVYTATGSNVAEAARKLLDVIGAD